MLQFRLARGWRRALATLRPPAAGPPALSAPVRWLSKHMWNEIEEGATKAQIQGIEELTPTVKRFTLAVEDPAGFRFAPGQWVDFFIPGVPQVGGYSFTSTPADLEARGTFQLAVKRSGYPPAVWLHDQARRGDWVQVRPGGSFTYSPGDEARPLLFLAGGIGITPLLSILRHCWQQAQHAQPGPPAQAAAAAQARGLRALLLYSVSRWEEFALLPDLRQLEGEAAGGVQLRLRATSPNCKGREAEWGGQWGRFTATDVRAAVAEVLGASHGSSQLQGCGDEVQQKKQQQQGSPLTAGSERAVSDVLAFVCGPPGMLRDTLQHLQAAGLAPEQVRYEKWW